MNFWQAFIEALESLTSNKLRSGLTILGIVIGVGAVIAMLAIGAGAENSITGEIQGIGSNLIFVFRGGSEEVRNPKPLTLGDADALGAGVLDLGVHQLPRLLARRRVRVLAGHLAQHAQAHVPPLLLLRAP